MEVCELATQFLEEACESVDILQLVVAMQPTLDHLGDVGHGLLMKFVEFKMTTFPLIGIFTSRFMSTPVGFRYLFDSGYIDREMDIWLHVRALWFHDKLHTNSFPVKGTQHSLLVEIEVWLAKTMEFIPVDDKDDIQ
jgi:hypothetical protein